MFSIDKTSDKILNFVDTGTAIYTRKRMFKPLSESCRTIVFMFSITDFFKIDDYCSLQFHKALDLFKQMILETECSRIFLVINKSDKLSSQLRNVDITSNFAGFSGNPRSKRDVQKFIIRRFTEKAMGMNRQNSTVCIVKSVCFFR